MVGERGIMRCNLKTVFLIGKYQTQYTTLPKFQSYCKYEEFSPQEKTDSGKFHLNLGDQQQLVLSTERKQELLNSCEFWLMADHLIRIQNGVLLTWFLTNFMGFSYNVLCHTDISLILSHEV
jgi:hypothetical protein